MGMNGEQQGRGLGAPDLAWPPARSSPALVGLFRWRWTGR